MESLLLRFLYIWFFLFLRLDYSKTSKQILNFFFGTVYDAIIKIQSITCFHLASEMFETKHPSGYLAKLTFAVAHYTHSMVLKKAKEKCCQFNRRSFKCNWKVVVHPKWMLDKVCLGAAWPSFTKQATPEEHVQDCLA